MKLIMMASLFVLVTGGFLMACSSDDVKGSNNEGSRDKENTENAADGDKKEISFYFNGNIKPTHYKYAEELEKLSGYKLDFEYAEEYSTQLPVLFASGDLPDVIDTDSIQSSLHEGAVENGVFMELGPLIEEHGKHILENIPEDLWKSPRVSKDGKIYALPKPNKLLNNMIIYVRKDWLDKLGMEVPKTLDDWLAYYEAIKQNDMNDNGDPNDEYGFNAIPGRQTMFFGAFGVSPGTWHMRAGKMIPDMILPETKEAIAFYRKLYSEGYVNPDMFTRGAADWVESAMSGEAGSWQYMIDGYGSAFSPSQENIGLPDDAEIKLIPPPVGPNGESGFGEEKDGIITNYVIPAGTENPEKIIKYWDWGWSSEEAADFFTFGIEGYNYEVNNGEIQWDPNAPENLEEHASNIYHVSLNTTGDERLKPRLLKHHPDGDMYLEATKIAEEYMIKDDVAHMPTLESFKSAPELVPGVGEGTLFLEMFAKVVTGKVELDHAFDEFVNTWKKRGGEEAIQEATDWYNDFYEN